MGEYLTGILTGVLLTVIIALCGLWVVQSKNDEFKSLERAGLIERRRGALVLTDTSRLRPFDRASIRVLTASKFLS